jgi:hypothetical protein
VGEDQDSVALDDGVQTMGNRDHSRVLELSLDQALDSLLRDQIDVRGRLVEHHDLVLSQDGSADTNKLAFTSGQVRTALRNLEVDASTLLLAALTLLSLSV